MSVPITRGRPYYATFTSSTAIVPVENGNITINIGPKYLFAPSSSVIVSRYFDRTYTFEAIIQSYDPSGSDIVLSEITSIKGNWTNISGDFIISLTGQRGSLITQGITDPNNSSGRAGDMYIKSSTGDIFLKY